MLKRIKNNVLTKYEVYHLQPSYRKTKEKKYPDCNQFYQK